MVRNWYMILIALDMYRQMYMAEEGLELAMFHTTHQYLILDPFNRYLDLKVVPFDIN